MQTRSPFVGAKAELDTQQQTLSRSSLEAHWLPAIGLAVLLGGLFAFLASGGVPAPIPVDGVSPVYWIGWSPLIGLAVFAYLLIASGDSNRRSTYGLGACLLLLAALISGLTAWGRTDDIAILTAIHLPFVVWIAFGWAVTKTDEGGDQFFAYLLKSVETVVAAGLYLIAGAIFFRLTIGIFSVLGVPVPKAAIESLVAFGLGVVPLLALASVYDPQSTPLAQSWSRGLARIVRILPRLMLPAAIGILLIYILWFVPTRFWQPFEDRSALIVYNATIVAIIAVMSTSVTGLDETTDNRYDGLLRYGILAARLADTASQRLRARRYYRPHHRSRPHSQSPRCLRLERRYPAHARPPRLQSVASRRRTVGASLPPPATSYPCPGHCLGGLGYSRFASHVAPARDRWFPQPPSAIFVVHKQTPFSDHRCHL